MEPPAVRTFGTGATRDTDLGKHDPEGFLSPLVLDRFNSYMHKNRYLADGTLRDSDNWQAGIPLEAYMKSGWRHFLDLWSLHRGYPGPSSSDLEETLCAVLFNTMGYLHVVLEKQQVKTHTPAEWDAAEAKVAGRSVSGRRDRDAEELETAKGLRHLIDTWHNDKSGRLRLWHDARGCTWPEK